MANQTERIDWAFHWRRALNMGGELTEFIHYLHYLWLLHVWGPNANAIENSWALFTHRIARYISYTRFYLSIAHEQALIAHNIVKLRLEGTPLQPYVADDMILRTLLVVFAPPVLILLISCCLPRRRTRQRA